MCLFIWLNKITGDSKTMFATPGLPTSKPVWISYVTWRREEGTYYELFTQWTVYILLLTSISQSCILSSISIPSYGWSVWSELLYSALSPCCQHPILSTINILYINHSMFSTRSRNYFEIPLLILTRTNPSWSDNLRIT